jgi:hypothetical protein
MNFNLFKRTKTLEVDGTKIEVPKNAGLTLGKFHEKLNKYPVLCIIFSKRGRSWKLGFDWAGLFKKEDVEYYRLKKRKATFKPPQFKSVITAENGQDVVVLQNLTRDEYYPVEVGGETEWLQFAENQQALRNFLVSEVVRIKTKGQSFLTQNLPLILLVVVFMMFIISGWVFWDAMGDLVIQQTGTVNAFTSKLSEITLANPPQAPVW